MSQRRATIKRTMYNEMMIKTGAKNREKSFIKIENYMLKINVTLQIEAGL